MSSIEGGPIRRLVGLCPAVSAESPDLTSSPPRLDARVIDRPHRTVLRPRDPPVLRRPR